MKAPPRDIPELLDRARAMAGLSLGDIANSLKISIPSNLKKQKGWPGQLIETALGAQAGSKPEQDFAHLGVELKTIPIGDDGLPLETTYVCYAHLTGVQGLSWQASNVRNKLACVLWVPIEGQRNIQVPDRRIATPFLWRPHQQEEALLRQDWEELMEMICTGQVERLTARTGQALHIRPKAADGSALTQAIGPDGQQIQTRPRGFYLRKDFTAHLIKQAFELY